MKRSGAEYCRVRLQLYYLLVAETTRRKVEMIIDIKASDTAHSSFSILSIKPLLKVYESCLLLLTKDEWVKKWMIKKRVHHLSCHFCNKNINANGKMPIEITCRHCMTLLM
jgi:hypothetical protein